MTLLFVILVAGSVASFAASRHRVFAAGGQTDCYPCDMCVFPYSWIPTGSEGVRGQLLTGTQTPAQEALIGPYLGGTVTSYTSLLCYNNVINPVDAPEIDVVIFATNTPDCTATGNPPPVGAYTGSDPKTPSRPITTTSQTQCDSY